MKNERFSCENRFSMQHTRSTIRSARSLREMRVHAALTQPGTSTTHLMERIEMATAKKAPGQQAARLGQAQDDQRRRQAEGDLQEGAGLDVRDDEADQRSPEVSRRSEAPMTLRSAGGSSSRLHCTTA